jgi:hypothetical protein
MLKGMVGATLALALGGGMAGFGQAPSPAPAQVQVPPSVPKLKAKAPAPPRARKRPAKYKQMELNSATKAQLMTLPGITGPLADKIIAARPLYTKAKLAEILPQGYYVALRDKVMVAPPPLPKK